MSVRKIDGGKPQSWLADVHPGGRDGQRRRKCFATKGETLAGETFLILMEQHNRRLSEMEETWFQLHGKTLGIDERINR